MRAGGRFHTRNPPRPPASATRDHPPRAAQHDREAGGAGGCHSGGKPVEAVEQVDRVDEHQHERNRDERGDRAATAHDRGGSRSDRDLTGEPELRRQVADVIGDAECERERERNERGRTFEGDDGTDREEHRYTAEVRHGCVVHLQRTGSVHDSEAGRDLRHER